MKPAYIRSVFLLECVTMIEGVCPKCGNRYYGWVLLQPQHQSCSNCGVGLLITEDGKRTIQGYSPFAAEEYKINSSSKIIPDSKSSKNNVAKE